MTLFVGALLRTIEFVMVTTDASFLGPGECGRGGSREPGSGAEDARGGKGHRWRGTGPPSARSPGDAVHPEPAEERQGCRGALDRCWGGRCPPLSPWTTVQIWAGLRVHKSLPLLLDWPVLLVSRWSLLPSASGCEGTSDLVES